MIGFVRPLACVGIFLVSLTIARLFLCTDYEKVDHSTSLKKNEAAVTTNTPNSTPMCTTEQIAKGEWLHKVLPKAPFREIDSKGLCKIPVQSFEKPWDTYDWHPYAGTSGECEYTRWDETRFCEAANNKTIAFVGDSLSFEHLKDLLSRFGYHVSKSDWLTAWRNRGRPINKAICNETVNAMYLRSTDLTNTGDLFNTSSPDVLILNRGAHYKDDELVAKEMKGVLETLKSWQQDCRTMGKTCQLLYRTTTPGHPFCWDYTKPVKSVEEMEAVVENRSNYVGVQGTFMWWNFKRQNRLILDLFRNATDLEYDVIPGYDMTILRPDRHVGPTTTERKGNATVPNYYFADCLHSCNWGKALVYNEVLLHFMVRNDVKNPH